MSYWSGEKLEERLKTKNIIDPHDLKKIDCNAYTLTIGNEVYVTPHHEITDLQSYTKKFLEPDESFSIPPGQFAYLITRETVNVPTDAMAFISMKSTTKFKGLINVSGFHVDPGYTGKLIFAVFNAGPTKLNLQRGQGLFLIWFSDLDRVSAEPYVKTAKDKSYFHIPPDLIDGIPGYIDSIKSLSDRIEQNRQSIAILDALVRIITPFVIILFVAALGIGANAIFKFIPTDSLPDRSAPASPKP